MVELKQSTLGSLLIDSDGPGASLRSKLAEYLVCIRGFKSLAPKIKKKKKSVTPSIIDDVMGKRLAELLKEETSESELERFEELRPGRIVERLKSVKERKEAAEFVRMLAKDDPRARVEFARLGAIPLLVNTLDSEDVDLQVECLYALLNLGIRNPENKAAMVSCEALQKLVTLVNSNSAAASPLTSAIAANLLALSALDCYKPLIGSSGLIPFLLRILRHGCGQAKEDSLRAIFNLSIASVNIPLLLKSNLIPDLLSILDDPELSERSLAVIFNVVSLPAGRVAVGSSPAVLQAMADILHWSDAPHLQTLAAQILMVMAYRDYKSAMVEAGIVSSLLELTLMGSAELQKMASTILGFLMVDRNARKKTQTEEEDEKMSEERKEMKKLVKLSLQSNMRKIVNRANIPEELGGNPGLLAHSFRK